MSKLFEGGVPTAPDVEKLIKEIEVTPGKSVTYAEVERIIGEHHKTSRFRTVTMSWRKKLFRERGQQTQAEGEEFHFLTPEQAVDTGVRDVHRVGRQIGRVSARAAVIDQNDLSEEKRTRHGLLVRETQAMLDQSRRSMKAIIGPGSVRSVTRVAR